MVALGEVPEPIQSMHFYKHFKPKSCSVHLAAKDKESALSEIVDNLVVGECLAAAQAPLALAALREREKLGTSGVGNHVAIPHVKLVGLERAACALSIHHEGLDWSSVDGARVHIVFTVLRPERSGAYHDPERHLELMQWIARLARDGDFRRFALKVKTKPQLVDLLKEMSIS